MDEQSRVEEGAQRPSRMDEQLRVRRAQRARLETRVPLSRVSRRPLRGLLNPQGVSAAGSSSG